ncbi:MAG: response regulator [Desulfobacterales bacterium]|nr:response regulator [Desulfobacterales bacterium]
MEKTSRHKALLVGDKSKVLRFLNIDVSALPVEARFSENGEAALEIIQSEPVALVISDQRLSGMAGTHFLEQVKKHSPETVRLLLTRYSDMDTVKSSVNKGAVHRYIFKVRGGGDAMEDICAGLNQYEIEMEIKADLEKAKDLNRQLYELDSELIDSRKSLDQAHEEIDLEISRLEAEIRKGAARGGLTSGQVAELADTHLGGQGGITAERIDQLYSHSVKQVFARFEEIAKRSGFQMPKPGRAESYDGE